MTRSLNLCALGAPVRIDCAGDRAGEAHDALTQRWSLCARDDEAPDAVRIEVDLGGAPDETPSEAVDTPPRRVTGDDLRTLMVALTQAVTRAAIEANIGELLMFHAAGLANLDTGASVVLVAPGGTGKTTVCRTLGPGRGYLSDETVGVAEDGGISGYPKPLSVRRPGGEDKDEIDPAGLGLQLPGVAASVHAVLLLDRSAEGPDVPVLERLDPFDAIIALTPETSSLERLPRPLHRLQALLQRVELSGRVRYREAGALEPVLSELIGPPRMVDPR